MTATLTGPTTLTMAEIERLYDGEWVLLANPTVAPDGAVLGGSLLAHDVSGDAAFHSPLPEGVRDVAVLFVGVPPLTENIVLELASAQASV